MGNQMSDVVGSITTPMTCTCNGGGNNVNAERGDYEQKRGEYEDMSANQLIEIFGSPVHAAAVLGSASDIAALVSKGHGFDERDRAGRTPCHVAAIMGNVQNLQTLVDFGANLEIEDFNGNTPLQSASRCNRDKVVKWIKWRIWSDQNKRSSGTAISPPSSFHSTPSDHIALPQNGDFSRSYTAIPGPDGRLHANGGEIGRTPPTPLPDSDPPNSVKHSITPTLQLSRAVAMNGKNRASAIPAMPPRGTDAGKIDVEISEPFPRHWMDTETQGLLYAKIRALEGILHLAFPRGPDFDNNQLRWLIQQSDNDMVYAIALAADHYASD